MIKAIIDSLASTSSRNTKSDILTQNQSNTLLRTVFKMALDGNIRYHILKIPDYTPNTGKGYIDLETAIERLEPLYSRTHTGNEAIMWLKGLLEALSADDADILEKIIGRDLRCGVSEKTVNKVWSNLIQEVPYMRCESYKLKNLMRIRMPALAQTKADGLFINFIVENGNVSYITRNGHELDLRGYQHDVILKMAEGLGNCVFHGEGLVKDGKGGYLKRKVGNGIINKAQVSKGKGISDAELDNIVFKIWDTLPLDDWKASFSPITCQERWNNLNDAFDRVESERVQLIDYVYVTSLAEAQEFFESRLALDEEGIILKDLKGPWESKSTPSKYCVKMKDEKECDLIVVGWNEGTGQFEGMMGSLDCESACGKLKVNISGWNVDDRTRLTPDNTLGKIIAVKFNEAISSKNKDTYSLFLPRVNKNGLTGVEVLELRDDKTNANTLQEILAL